MYIPLDSYIYTHTHIHILTVYTLYIYNREQEVESEMIQEMSVNGRIRAFERKIKQNNKNGTGKSNYKSRIRNIYICMYIM